MLDSDQVSCQIGSALVGRHVVGHLSSHRRRVILSPGDLSAPPVFQFVIVNLNYMIFIYTECTPIWLPELIVYRLYLQAHLFTIIKNLILILLGLRLVLVV